MAARIDSFSKPEQSTWAFGQKLREQLEERLTYWSTGKVPRTNQEVMEEAYDEVQLESPKEPTNPPAKTEKTESKKEKKKKKKKKKRKAEEAQLEAPKAKKV